MIVFETEKGEPGVDQDFRFNFSLKIEFSFGKLVDTIYKKPEKPMSQIYLQVMFQRRCNQEEGPGSEDEKEIAPRNNQHGLDIDSSLPGR